MLYTQEAYRANEHYLGIDFSAIKNEIIIQLRKFHYNVYVNCDSLLALKKDLCTIKINSIGSIEILSEKSNDFSRHTNEITEIEKAFKKFIPGFSITEKTFVPISNSTLPVLVGVFQNGKSLALAHELSIAKYISTKPNFLEEFRKKFGLKNAFCEILTTSDKGVVISPKDDDDS